MTERIKAGELHVDKQLYDFIKSIDWENSLKFLNDLLCMPIFLQPNFIYILSMS